MKLSETLPGTWLLESRIDVTGTGERHPEPLLGEDPVSLLIYDRSGHFSVQFMKRDRSAPMTITSSAPAKAAPASVAGSNNTQSQAGYDAYFGTYSVDDTNGTVTQQLMGSLSAGNVGMVLTRKMEVLGNKLVIQLSTSAADGTPVTRTLTWKRLAGTVGAAAARGTGT